MDGSSSGASPPRESALPTTRSPLSDNDRELNGLRARAYGPKPDIDADPAAMARLIELEASHLASTAPAEGERGVTLVDAARPDARSPHDAVGQVEPTAVPPVDTPPAASSGNPLSSLWHRATATRRRRVGLAAGVIAIIAIFITSAIWSMTPHPDATLKVIAVDTDREIIEALESQGRDPNASTLRQFEAYHGIDVWSVENDRGNVCLIAWDSTGSGRFDTQCVPPGVEPVIHLGVGPQDDGFGQWLPDGSRISFSLRADTVDVFLHTPPAAG